MPQYFLSDDELAQMRADVAQMLPDMCVIQRAVRTIDAAGRGSVNWVAVGTVACRLDPARYRTQQMDTSGGREALSNLFWLTIAYDSDVLMHDRRVVHNGLVYEVRTLLDDHSWNVGRQAMVVRLD